MSGVPDAHPDMLAGLAGEVVKVFAPHTEASEVAIAAQFTVAYGNAVGAGPVFYVGETAHHANEFLFVTGATSRARKGDSFGIARRPLAEADPEWANKRVMGGLSSGEGLIFHVRDAVYGTATKGKDKGKTVLLDGGVTDKRLLAVETEATSVLKQTDRKGNTLSNTTRDAWDHRNLGTLTRNNPMRATSPHISIIAHCTDEDLVAHVSDGEAANGFANRFLFAKVHRAQRLPSPGRADAVAVDGLCTDVQAGLERARAVGTMTRTPSAERLWCGVYDSLTIDHPGLLGKLTARAEAHVVRLSMLFALFRGSPQINDNDLRSALAFWKYSFESTRLIFGSRTGNGDADRLKDGLPPGSSMRMTEIREEIFAGHITAVRLSAAIDLLLRLHEVRLEEENTGGRPAKVVYRNTESDRKKSAESAESPGAGEPEFADDGREAVG